MTAMAKVFKNGGSQAIRLPKEFRIDGDEVCIKQFGDAIIIYPKNKAWDLMRSVYGAAPDFPERDQPRMVEKRKRL